jgi:hypothetical protein
MLFVGSIASSRIDFILDSNSPLYLVQATSVPISSKNTFLFCSFSGTSFALILCTNHSTIAVFQTQASHMSRGLFFVFLSNVYITWSISFSLQITGSRYPSRASFVKSVQKYSIVSFFSSFFFGLLESVSKEILSLSSFSTISLSKLSSKLFIDQFLFVMCIFFISL